MLTVLIIRTRTRQPGIKKNAQIIKDSDNVIVVYIYARDQAEVI